MVIQDMDKTVFVGELASSGIVIGARCYTEARAIIEKYADEVFEFEWCNDFSKARNFQLDQTNGEWLLYLDDDEFFLDIASFVPFFSTDEYKEYNIGGYYQRNYLDKEIQTTESRLPVRKR